MADDFKKPDPIAAGLPATKPESLDDKVRPAPSTFPASAAPAPARPARTPAEHKDGSREVVETVVFVVVLVLLLKTFLAEAFVIPTGSMATTLLGYHKHVVCEQCRYSFPVNASEEVEGKPLRRVVGYICENCGYHKRLIPVEGEQR